MTAYPVEIPVPVLGAHAKGNTGIPYVTTLQGPEPGPHAMITALVHGNELCGAHALLELLDSDFRPARGQVSLVFVNIAAFERFDRTRPSDSRYVDEDFNRVWDPGTLDGDRVSSELIRARQLRPLLDRVDLLLDLHSMQHATAPLALAGWLAKGVDLGRRVGIPDLIVQDQGHVAGRRMRDYGQFGDPNAPAAALLVECGQHWARSSLAVARNAVFGFLSAHDYMAQDQRDDDAPPPNPSQRVIEVTQAITVETPEFRFADRFIGLEILPEVGSLIATDGPREIRSPYPDCVLVMPSLRIVPGQTAVRLGRFV